VLFSNDNEHGDMLHQAIKHVTLDHLLGLPDIDWSTRFKEKKAAESKDKERKARLEDNPLAPPRLPIASVSGTYSHPAYGDFLLGSFDIKQTEDSNLISHEDAQAIASWIDEPLDKQSAPLGVIRAGKLFGKYLLLRHKQKDSYSLTNLGIVKHRDTKKAFAIETYSRGRLTIVENGIVFDDNFWGAEEDQTRPLADPSKGEVFFQRVVDVQ
jgi:hypothetical protein